MLLTADNYLKGFLVDDELMGGVTPHPEQPDTFVAFVLRHTTGEYLGYQPFSALDEALGAINQVQRPWSFEKVSGCGNGGCGGGACKGANQGGGCAAMRQKEPASEDGSDSPNGGCC